MRAVVGASVGIAVYPDHGMTSEVLIKRADAAMYAVKRKGKNNYQFAQTNLEVAAPGETGTDGTS